MGASALGLNPIRHVHVGLTSRHVATVALSFLFKLSELRSLRIPFELCFDHRDSQTFDKIKISVIETGVQPEETHEGDQMLGNLKPWG